ncbi:MAG: serine hydrolase [Gammaproteobacteria bacterium]|nr:serine hydrolase [Gammaproteobacteria bacterium]MCW5583139.1 serine hydrolase [Gammaproteobacteria bacterium]
MKKVRKVLSALVLSAISISTYAQVEADSHTAFIQKTMTVFMEKNAIPGAAVELYIDGQLYEYYYGYANREKKEPVIRKTIFEIGSISKIMTSILFAQEIDWAKMSFSDPITKYIKDLPEYFSKIKLQDLATHTSGLPFSLPKAINTKEDLRQYLSARSPGYGPGEQWMYSNLGTGLLGYALESSTEKDFDDLYRRHILNPLKMVTGVSIPANLTKYYAQGYDKNGEVASRTELGLFPAAMGVKASAADMQRFLSAAIGLPGTPPRIFYPMRMTESVYVKFSGDFQGLAWQIHAIEKNGIARLLNLSDMHGMGPVNIQQIYPRPVYNGDALIDKLGTTQGFSSYIAVIPNKKSGIVILTNKDVPNSAIVKTARDILFKVTQKN